MLDLDYGAGETKEMEWLHASDSRDRPSRRAIYMTTAAR